MTPEYVKFDWNIALGRKHTRNLTYEVWYDEGESGRAINNFVVLANNLNA